MKLIEIETNWIYVNSYYLWITGRYKEAVEDLRQAIKIDPNFEDAEHNLRQALQDWNLANL